MASGADQPGLAGEHDELGTSNPGKLPALLGALLDGQDISETFELRS